MVWKEGEYWLRSAVKYIKFPPDRRRVQEELYAHMISRNQDFLAEGYSDEEADRRVCEAMGDPDEVGKALAEVHKPFWGYFLRALRIVTVLILLLCAVTVFREFQGTQAVYYLAIRAEYEVRMEEWIGQASAERCGDYRFRLMRAGIAVSDSEDEAAVPRGRYLVLELRAATRDPFLGGPLFDGRKLRVEDSRGNRYDTLRLYQKERIWRSDILLIVPDFDPESEWAVLIYDAPEQGFRLPVRLKEASA